VRGPLPYVHDRVPPIGGRQRVPEPPRASLRFSVVVYVCTSAILGTASFRGRGSPVGPGATAEGRRGYTRAQPVTGSSGRIPEPFVKWN